MAGAEPKDMLKRALRRTGFELQRYDPEATYAKRRQRLLEANEIDLVLDVGAHAGEFGQALRHEGYAGRIVSFEPLTEMHRRLEATAAGDRNWTTKRAAVGDRSGEIEIQISGNDGFSSSIRPMATIHEEADPDSSYVGSETVRIVTLDEEIDDLVAPADRVMLKVDTQGYESETLAGAESMLLRCQLVELELGLAELYEGQALFQDLLDQMMSYGFVLTDVEPGFVDRQTSRLLQVDGLFIR